MYKIQWKDRVSPQWIDLGLSHKDKEKLEGMLASFESKYKKFIFRVVEDKTQ